MHCLITSEGPYGNMHSYEHCKLSGLPDLNHSDPQVVHRLVEWMKWTEKEFQPDGIRFDACHNSLEVGYLHNITACRDRVARWLQCMGAVLRRPHAK